jgi:hypothetical protein
VYSTVPSLFPTTGSFVPLSPTSCWEHPSLNPPSALWQLKYQHPKDGSFNTPQSHKAKIYQTQHHSQEVYVRGFIEKVDIPHAHLSSELKTGLQQDS